MGGVSAIIRIFVVHRPEPPTYRGYTVYGKYIFNVPIIVPHRRTKENPGFATDYNLSIKYLESLYIPALNKFATI